jgi:hypothetical protein
MSSHVEQHTLYQVANAPLRGHPFPHILVHEVFEPAFYRRLQENLLPAEHMRPIREVRKLGKKYSDARYVLGFGPDALGALPGPQRAFWQELAGWLLAMPFAQVLFAKFADGIAQRFGQHERSLYNEALLVDDRTSYSLGPHSDAETKVVTVLFYLPADASRPHLGTSIYAPRDPAFRCPGGPHYPFENFDRVVTMPYVPNTMFAFLKTDNSFHGVEPIRDADYRRHLLLYDIYCTREDLAPAPRAQAPAAAAAPGAPSVEFKF